MKFERDYTRFQSIAGEADGLRLRYTRVYTVQTEGAACWARIVAETHLPPAPPLIAPRANCDVNVLIQPPQTQYDQQVARGVLARRLMLR